MSDRRARHARPPRLHVGPFMALEGILVILAARSEAQAATDAQNGTERQRTSRLRSLRTLTARMSVAFTAALIFGAALTQLGRIRP